METKKEQWVNKTIDSVNTLQRQPISEELKERLFSIPKEINIHNRTIPISAVWLAAASVALLIAINVVTVKKVRTSKQQNNTIITEYFSYLDQV
jgi:hypothetical protein